MYIYIYITPMRTSALAYMLARTCMADAHICQPWHVHTCMLARAEGRDSRQGWPGPGGRHRYRGSGTGESARSHGVYVVVSDQLSADGAARRSSCDRRRKRSGVTSRIRMRLWHVRITRCRSRGGTPPETPSDARTQHTGGSSRATRGGHVRLCFRMLGAPRGIEPEV